MIKSRNKEAVIKLIKRLKNIEDKINLGLWYLVATSNCSDSYHYNFYAMSRKLEYCFGIDIKLKYLGIIEAKIEYIITCKNRVLGDWRKNYPQPTQQMRNDINKYYMPIYLGQFKNESMKTTAVIVARMQTPYLHEGHKELIRHAGKDVDTVVIVLGDSPVKFTNRNPLSFEIRATLIKEEFPFMIIERIQDHPSDKIWSKNLDELLSKYENPILFGSRDSFIDAYSGKYPTNLYTGPSLKLSSTQIRKAAANLYAPNVNLDNRVGIIHAVENRYPVVYPTVDVAPINGEELLLGRKKGHEKYCFIGGFVDVKDPNYIYAAFRELTEELKGVKLVTPLELIGSFKIDDWRYKDTKDSIMTTFFTTVIDKENIEAADDIEEFKWFNIDEFNIELLQPSHHILFNSLKKHLYV